MIGRFLVLIAVLLMPLGMQPAHAAMTAPTATNLATMPPEHCPDQGSTPEKGQAPACTMACSAALPAVDDPAEQLQPTQPAPAISSEHQALLGVQPETATPPPRMS